ncbi:hypothetical protein BGLT_03740 [Caballeronia glathei]|jgi:hypothetical protein|uniref:Uncharacterized protein n=1 Tax=Caballeronia glathei TaxID=60547 RepID=A0A069PG10_9BURK|nr:hypothetical protein BG61_37360 [Caballeronia glathei]TCK35264.1 hypothetical protein B0G84_7239 [Paraburkholderia sp. BL8N3]CDY74799.1 hypothetical protein BGLT_03740 [Caballeronia glathei]
MPQFLTHCWQSLFARVKHARERRFLRAARRAMNGCGCEAPKGDASHDDGAKRAERLQCIALYAQAGYFNMGYAVDAFQPPVEPPPH